MAAFASFKAMMVPDYAMIGGKTQGPELELCCLRAVPFQHGAAASSGFRKAVHRSQGVHPTGIIPVFMFQRDKLRRKHQFKGHQMKSEAPNRPGYDEKP